jgi:hypothetical protein
MKLTLILILLLLLCPNYGLAEEYDQPVTLKASEVLPPELLSSPSYKIGNEVHNDGFLNTYTVDSQWGQLKVVSTPLLRKRAHELNAMAQMEKLKGSKEFKDGVKNSAKKVVDGAEQIITDPGGTIKNVGKGVGGLFKSIGGVFKGGDKERGETEGNTLERVSGFSKAKRQYAAKFGVDPYSRNEYLQKELGDISQAGFLGSTITSLGLGALGGAVVSVASNADTFNDLIHEKSPDKLRDFNRKKLETMDVSEDVIDLFTRNTNYTITEQTAIVAALDSMDKTKERRDFVKFAVLSDSPEIAVFRTVQIQLYATYNQTHKPVDQFEYFGEFACGRVKDGSLLVVAPVDYLLWTKELGPHLTAMSQQLSKSNPSSRKVLWVSGTLSPLALKHMKALGWEIQQNAFKKLS